MFFPYKNNITTTLPLSGKTFLQILARHTSATSQAGNFTRQASPYEQNKIIWLVEMFSR
jgi:hypothetical protein